MSILKGDFAKLCCVDSGFFGTGVYFTHDLPYALDYGNWVIVCLVGYANPYPAIEEPEECDENTLKVCTIRGF